MGHFDRVLQLGPRIPKLQQTVQEVLIKPKVEPSNPTSEFNYGTRKFINANVVYLKISWIEIVAQREKFAIKVMSSH